VTLSERQQAFAANVAKLIIYINDAGYRVTLGEALRTPEQAALYAAKGVGSKNSLHIKKLAIDLNLFKDGAYLPGTEDHREFGTYWETLDECNRWGGRYHDGNHYEMLEVPR
jgi:hypothetical protein